MKRGRTSAGLFGASVLSRCRRPSAFTYARARPNDRWLTHGQLLFHPRGIKEDKVTFENEVDYEETLAVTLERARISVARLTIRIDPPPSAQRPPRTLVRRFVFFQLILRVDATRSGASALPETDDVAIGDNGFSDSARHDLLARLRRSRVSASGEGIDEHVQISDDKLSSLYTSMAKDRVVLLHAPFAAGKTTLCDAFCDYLERKECVHYFLTMATAEAIEDMRGMDAYFAKKGQGTWSAILKRTHFDGSNTDAVFVVIDEAQVIHEKTFFWSSLKQAVQECPRLHVVLCSSFLFTLKRAGTPPDVNIRLDLDFLRLSKEQVTLLLASLQVSVSEQVRAELFRLTSGHAGLLRRTIDALVQEKLAGEPEQLAFLQSSALLNYLSTMRSLRWIVEYSLNDVERHFLAWAITARDTETLCVPIGNYRCPESLMRIGLYARLQDEGQVCVCSSS